MAANGNSNTQGNIHNFLVKGGVSKTGPFESDTMAAILKSIETMQKNQDEHFTAQTKMLNDVLIDQKETIQVCILLSPVLYYPHTLLTSYRHLEVIGYK